MIATSAAIRSTGHLPGAQPPTRLVGPTVAQTLGVREAGGQPLEQRLQDELRDRELLLLLDNFEHLVAAAPVVANLLTACPRLKVLVTSREALNLSGEQEYHLSPLPGHDAAARVKLLPPEALSVRLQRPLELLIGGARDRPSRQQTLRATIDWSYGLLDPAERREYAYRSGSCRRPSHVERLRQRVVLIDGEQLADLMIEHVVGGHHLDPMARRPGPLAR